MQKKLAGLNDRLNVISDDLRCSSGWNSCAIVESVSWVFADSGGCDTGSSTCISERFVARIRPQNTVPDVCQVNIGDVQAVSGGSDIQTCEKSLLELLPCLCTGSSGVVVYDEDVLGEYWRRCQLKDSVLNLPSDVHRSQGCEPLGFDEIFDAEED